MPRSPSRRTQAAKHVEHALSESSKALSKLGGKVRYGSKKLPPSNIYQARGMLESVIARLNTIALHIAADNLSPQQVEDALTVGHDPAWNDRRGEAFKERLDATGEAVKEFHKDIFPTPPFGFKDEFEAAYDKERSPEC